MRACMHRRLALVDDYATLANWAPWRRHQFGWCARFTALGAKITGFASIYRICYSKSNSRYINILRVGTSVAGVPSAWGSLTMAASHLVIPCLRHCTKNYRNTGFKGNTATASISRILDLSPENSPSLRWSGNVLTIVLEFQVFSLLV